jgi:hypothetical protein
VTELNWFTVLSLIFLTIVQHETGVILWYRFFQHRTEPIELAALYAFVAVSIIDLIWLYVLWVVTEKSLTGLSHVAWIHRWMDRQRQKPWIQRVSAWFSKPSDTAEPTVNDSSFRRMLKKSGYVGIALCAALPAPGIKEVGIIMSLTPRYRRAGFHVMYVGGMVKTIMTMLVYGGLYSIFERIFS